MAKRTMWTVVLLVLTLTITGVTMAESTAETTLAVAPVVDPLPVLPVAPFLVAMDTLPIPVACNFWSAISCRGKNVGDNCWGSKTCQLSGTYWNGCECK